MLEHDTTMKSIKVFLKAGAYSDMPVFLPIVIFAPAYNAHYIVIIRVEKEKWLLG